MRDAPAVGPGPKSHDGEQAGREQLDGPGTIPPPGGRLHVPPPDPGAQYRSQPDCGFAGRTVRRRGYRPGNNAWWLYWYWRQGFHPCVLDRIAGSNPVHVTQQLKSSSPVGVRSTLISGSSAAERPPVKRMVPGSNPGRRARSKDRYSCIAQMVRASGCYPESPRFESWCGSWGKCRKLHGTPRNRTCGCGLPTSGRLAER